MTTSKIYIKFKINPNWKYPPSSPSLDINWQGPVFKNLAIPNAALKRDVKDVKVWKRSVKDVKVFVKKC